MFDEALRSSNQGTNKDCHVALLNASHLAAVVAHREARGGHEGHERVHHGVARVGHIVLNLVRSGHTAGNLHDTPHSDARNDGARHQQPEGLVQGHVLDLSGHVLRRLGHLHRNEASRLCLVLQ
eukprot:6236968-Pyramimonas_sp.AAC.1